MDATAGVPPASQRKPPPRKRRGLVLAGGGAKGAWQFGVLQAFAESGVQFDVVSGTSVGALNGAIWCTGRMDLGQNLWNSMARNRVFSLRRWLVVPALFAAGSRIFYAFYNGYVPRAGLVPRLVDMAFLLFVATPLLSSIYFTAQLSPNANELFICFLGFLVVMAWLIRPWNRPSKIPPAYLNAVFGVWIATIYMYLAGLFIGKRNPDGSVVFGHASFTVHFWNSIGAISTLSLHLDSAGSLFLWLGGAPFYLLGVAWVARRSNLSIFTAAPLNTIIDAFLVHPLRTPLFATAAREARYYDPDNLDHFQPPTMDTVPNDHLPIDLVSLVPVYTRVDVVEPNAAREMLLATSALPLGVVQARGSDDTRLMDGGVVDNVPWFPLMEEMPCDEIVIVHCSPAATWNDAAARKVWAAQDRMKRVVSLGFNPEPVRKAASVFNDPPRVVPLREPEHWPDRVILVAPERSLGNFITGTLNFSQAAASSRLIAGRETGLRVASFICGQR